MRRLSCALLVSVTLLTPLSPAAGAGADGCGSLDSSTCGVDSDGGRQFHGVIAVTNAAWVLDTASRSGSGCADCIWSIVIACPDNGDDDPTGPTQCQESLNAPKCDTNQTLYRVYLTTSTQTDVAEGTICLGGDGKVVPISQKAKADVDRYLKNVRPPDLWISTRPRDGTLTGLRTYFHARTPHSLRPRAFGGPDVTETITIAASELNWRFGDGHASGWSTSHRATHTYTYGGVADGQLITRWSASYTVSYAGRTFGPYDASGHVRNRQAFRLAVHHTRPVLVR
jgi:hypothetical protein